jgi:hypothetical protein
MHDTVTIESGWRTDRCYGRLREVEFLLPRLPRHGETVVYEIRERGQSD